MSVSLRIVIALLISVAAIIATVIAFIPTYLSGVKAVRSTLSDLRGAYVGRAGEGIDAFFDVPIATLQEVHTAISVGMVNMTDEAAWVVWMTNYSQHYPNNVNIISKRMWVGTGQNYSTYSSIDQRYKALFGGTIYVTVNYTHVLIYNYDQNTLQRDADPMPSPYTQEIPSTYQSHPEIAAKNNPTASVIYSHVYMGWDSPQVAATLVIPDPLNPGHEMGCIAAEIHPGNLDTFFASLDLRGGSRAIVVDGTTALMLGNSWGETSALRLGQYVNAFAPEHLRLQMKTLTNHSDATVLKVVSEVGANTILTGAAPYATELHSGTELTYVDVREVTGPGLRLRLLLVMPEIDFMEEVYETQTVTITIVVVLALLMIAGSIVVAHLLTKPLVDLKERMELTASLKHTEDDGSLSTFGEVADMQKAYRRMKKELNRMKSYLPQSVLHANTTEEDDEDDKGALNATEGAGQVSQLSRASTGNTPVSISETGSFTTSDRRVSFMIDGKSDRSTSLRGVAKASCLNTRGEVSNKRVSVIVFNLRAFHLLAKKNSNSSGAMVKVQKEYLEVIERTVRENKGVVDVFQGDHVTCSFNAIGTCPAHNRRAACVALQVVETLSSRHVTAGLATGSAFVGNMGTDNMRRFCIIGPAVPQAMTLERLTKRYSSAVKVLMTQSMLTDIDHEYKFAVVDRLMLPGQNRSPQIVAALLGRSVATAQEEWMYDLSAAESSDPFKFLNQAWGAVSVSPYEVATKLTLVDKELEAIANAESEPTPPSNGVDGSNSHPNGGNPDDVSAKQDREIPPLLREVLDTSHATLAALSLNHQEDWVPDEIYNDLTDFYRHCVL